MSKLYTYCVSAKDVNNEIFGISFLSIITDNIIPLTISHSADVWQISFSTEKTLDESKLKQTIFMSLNEKITYETDITKIETNY